MTRVLMVAYYYPPRGGAGTQRFAKFCKYLPDHGIDPIVLTSGLIEKDANAPHDDPSLGGGTAIVERVDAPARVTMGSRLRRRLRFFLDEDEWAAAAEERAVELVRQHAPEAVVTTVSPFACYRIGARLKRDFGLPWLLDLRDPWSLDGWRRYRSAWHARFDLGHMRRALRTADVVIANVPQAAAEYVALGAFADRTVVIPNGFDDEDFAGEPATSARDGRFHLVHMGTFHAVDAPEGLTTDSLTLKRHRQIAPLGRTGYYLLKAMALLRERAPSAYALLTVSLFGHVDETHRQMIDDLGLADRLALRGYVRHRDTIAALVAADAVFVPLHGVPPGERALVIPGKLYEALASERAVLAALPPGDGADLVRSLNAGIVVPATDAEALSRALEQLLVAHAAGHGMRGCRRADLAPFTRRHLTGLFAQVLRASIERQGRISIDDPWQSLWPSAHGA